jgi:hypothetical protein
MNCAARSFSGLAVNRPRKLSPARRNKSAFKSCWRIESFRGADGSARGKAAVIKVANAMKQCDTKSAPSLLGDSLVALRPGFYGITHDESRSDPFIARSDRAIVY